MSLRLLPDGRPAHDSRYTGTMGTGTYKGYWVERAHVPGPNARYMHASGPQGQTLYRVTRRLDPWGPGAGPIAVQRRALAGVGASDFSQGFIPTTSAAYDLARVAALQRIADLARRIAASIRSTGGSTPGSSARLRAISDQDKLWEIYSSANYPEDVRNEARYTHGVAQNALTFGAIDKNWSKEETALNQLEQRAQFVEGWKASEEAAIAAARSADVAYGITKDVQSQARAEEVRLKELCGNTKEQWLLRAARLLPGASGEALARQYELTCKKDLGSGFPGWLIPAALVVGGLALWGAMK